MITNKEFYYWLKIKCRIMLRWYDRDMLVIFIYLNKDLNLQVEMHNKAYKNDIKRHENVKDPA